eukprot:CAMPEP_0201523808 /NCGR_PEP_ID=MMETSP0161_2-20130828/20935_1 /ASSEMBLY_ACC=CAM_ASM_000251 /TAXON_ID=180227 /ORGANISM="Neoparamoeba aestuarina, Strain SoJaBio B1-5/56/2" /LENGTH=514 /DNA_ID=CAMNT_0047923025 /DNA_START=96 /DNA_END=1640 /DNA_ORIENTATION=-
MTYNQNKELVMTMENYPDGKINWGVFDNIQRPVGSVKASYWDFIPAQIPHVAIIANGPEVTWEGDCYKTITASLVASESNNNATLTITTGDKKNAICSEFYDFGDRESAYLITLAVTNKHHINIPSLKPYEYQDLAQNGMKAFFFPGNIAEMAEALRKTLTLFKGKNMFQNNVDFIGEKMQWQMIKREAGRTTLPDSDIKSGDYLAILRLDGLDPLIMWGTGGHTGHTAVALWFGDELYICESTDSDTNSSVGHFWPPPYGVIRTPYDQWMDQAEQAGFIVAILRLNEEYQSQFNEETATAWFNTVQGSPYGWHNFIYTFMDTMYDNLPRPATPDLMEQVFGIYEPMVPPNHKNSVYSMIIMGLNHRLGSNCQTLQCIYDIIDPMGVPLFQVVGEPEMEDWTYQNITGNCPWAECYSMVCDVFVMEMYQNAGLNLPSFQATEMTPKDTYELAIFESNWHRPEICVKADPDLPYCQVLGDYILQLPGFNSRTPYANMNNNCPAYAPVYMRTPVDC